MTAEPVACADCGHPAAAGVRFCTRCGAVLPAPAPPDAAPTAVAPPSAAAATQPSAPAAPATPQPADQPTTRYALATPPANEPWWRNPIVVVAAVVSIVLGGGVASWRFFISTGGETVSAVRVLTPSQTAASSPATPTVATAPTADVAAPVRAIGRILQESASGRDAALNRRDYRAALLNRRRLLAELAQVDVPAEPQQLARAGATLRAALQASARADARHLACGCDDELADDVTASQLKRRFAILFDPYARRYLGRPVDPEQM